MKSISAKELYNLMLHQKQINVIDVREEYEHNLGHIPGSVNIPLMQLTTRPEKYLMLNQTYYIVCQSGSRSLSTCTILERSGYNVINVSGGHNSWPSNLIK